MKRILIRCGSHGYSANFCALRFCSHVRFCVRDGHLPVSCQCQKCYLFMLVVKDMLQTVRLTHDSLWLRKGQSFSGTFFIFSARYGTFAEQKRRTCNMIVSVSITLSFLGPMRPGMKIKRHHPKP